MTIRHTKGPWKRNGYAIFAGESLLIAQISGYTRREADANACLIAAAPDLLAALIAITDQLERVGDARKDRLLIEDARDAIASAYGSQDRNEAPDCGHKI